MLVLAGRFLFLLMLARVINAAPSGCTEIDGLYECVHGTVSLPVAETSFSSPVAQRVRLTNLNGALTTNVFDTTFNSIDTSLFDTNWAASLELKCASGSTLTLGQAAFQNMIHIRDIKIINCDVTVPANTFSNLIYLDRLVVENGTVVSWDADALTGMQILKFADPSPRYPVSTGELIFMNTKISSQALPSGFITKQGRLETVVLEGLDLNTIDATLFTNNTKLRFLSLGYNSFTEIPSGLLDGLDSLAELHLYDTQLECDCSKLWFFGHAETTKLKIRGDITCSSPSNWQYYRAASYYQSTCVAVEAECGQGIVLMGVCITFIELGMYILCICAFILAVVVLILVIHTKRQLSAGPSKKKGRSRSKPGGSKRRPPKETKKGWA